MDSSIYHCPSLSDVPADLVFPQNLPSIVCGHVLDPQPGEKVLDMCAAPGDVSATAIDYLVGDGPVVMFSGNMECLQ